MDSLTNLLRVALASLIVFTVNQLLRAEEPTVSVTGMAEIRVVPDQVILTAGVESRAKSVAEASADNDTKIRAIVELLKKADIEDRHIHTAYLSIEPIMPPSSRGYEKSNANSLADPFETGEEQPMQPVGYMASRQFAITLVDLKKFETIYKGLIERGINRVNGIEFQTSELRKHRDEARLQAVRAAKEKAEALSGELGARLAAIKTISESPSMSYGRAAMQNSISDPFGSDRAESPEPFVVGQITVRAVVDVVFNLGDAEMDE